LENKLKPGIREERYPKENICKGKFRKDNQMITILPHQIGSSEQRENREKVGNNQIKADSDMGKRIVKESQ